MKIYANIESKIMFINESDEQEFYRKYEKEYSVTKLETIFFGDGNVLKMELLKSKALKKYEHFLLY